MVSNAQTASNEATARLQATINNANQRTPYGNVSWNQENPGSDQWTQTIALSPEQQALYDSSMRAQQGAVDIAGQQLGRVGNALGQNLQLGQLQGAAGMGDIVSTPSYDSATQSFDQGRGVQTDLQQQGLQDQFAHGQDVQGGINNYGLQNTFSQGQQVQGQVGGQPFDQSVKAAQDAVYGQATSRLDPQWQQAEDQTRARLAAQGLAGGSTAAQTELGNLNRAKTDAYNQANYSAVQAGLGAQQQGYGQQLASGQFANQAAGQQYGQNLGQMQAYNAAQGQQFGQGQAQAEFANAAAGQQFAQGMGASQFFNQAANDRFAQAQAAGQFGNQGAAQQYTQNMGAADFANQARQQDTGNRLASAGFQNQAEQQAFAQQMQQRQFENERQQQQFQQQAYSQNQSINQMSALLGLGQVQAPQGFGYTPAQVANTNVLGAYDLNQQGQQAAYQAKMGAYGSALGGLFNLGSAGLTAGMKSDRRLKRDIHEVGERAGFKLYVYKLRGEDKWREGVMAQEVRPVRPDCVVEGPDGWLRVNYERLAA